MCVVHIVNNNNTYTTVYSIYILRTKRSVCSDIQTSFQKIIAIIVYKYRKIKNISLSKKSKVFTNYES